MIAERYSDFKLSPNEDKNCFTCHNPLLQSERIVAHSGTLGKGHPTHAECAKKCLELYAAICPVCKVELDPYSVYTEEERREMRRLDDVRRVHKVKVITFGVGLAAVSGAFAIYSKTNLGTTSLVSTYLKLAAGTFGGYLVANLTKNPPLMAAFIGTTFGNLLGSLGEYAVPDPQPLATMSTAARLFGFIFKEGFITLSSSVMSYFALEGCQYAAGMPIPPK